MAAENEPWWSAYALTAFSAFVAITADVLRRSVARRFKDLDEKELSTRKYNEYLEDEENLP